MYVTYAVDSNSQFKNMWEKLRNVFALDKDFINMYHLLFFPHTHTHTKTSSEKMIFVLILSKI